MSTALSVIYRISNTFRSNLGGFLSGKTSLMYIVSGSETKAFLIGVCHFRGFCSEMCVWGVEELKRNTLQRKSLSQQKKQGKVKWALIAPDRTKEQRELHLKSINRYATGYNANSITSCSLRLYLGTVGNWFLQRCIDFHVFSAEIYAVIPGPCGSEWAVGWAAVTSSADHPGPLQGDL